ERQGCQDEDEVRLFYRRLGCMLALIHALQGNDFHLENIVAAGPNPVAIDLETISVPRPYRDTSIMMEGKADDLVQRSVLRTLLLPSVMGMRGNHGVQNLGAIGVEIEAKGRPTIRKKLTGINTDFPRWVPMDADAPALQRNNQSQVLLEDGTAVDGNDYRSEVEHGYQIGYRSILKHRDQWLADDGPLQQLSDVWVRVLNRATNIYYQLLQETYDAARAASGVDRWVHTDRLLVNTQTVEPSDPIAQDTLNAVATSEKDAMMNGDIAYFITRGADTDYFAPDPISGEPRVIPIARLETSAMESAREQIRAMGDEDLQLQLKLMNSSYVAAQVSLDNMMHGRGIHTDGDEQNTQPKHAWSTDELDAWILRSLDCLESQAINDEESCNWIDYSHDPQTDVLQPTPLDLTIYSGLGGLALVLERAYRHFNDRRWLTLAKRCITHQFNAVTTMQTRGRFTGFDIEGPAGLMGRAGMIAACWAIGRHETHGKYRDVARRLTIDLDPRIIERDTGYDVISGSAGYMLLCMHLNRQEPIPGLDPILTALCGHLARNTSDIDGLGWLSAGPRPLCGFGHGRAGIGLALLEVGTHLNRSDYRDLGLETLRAESALKMDEHHGWPDLRSVGTGAPLPSGPQLNAWCAGAEGIASARAAALSLADDSFLEADLTYALDCVNAHQKSGRTHLCCGSAGRYEMYKSIDRVLGSAANDGKNASAMLHHSIDVEETDPTLPEHGTVGIGLFQGACGRVWSALSERMDDDASVTLLRF
ncbi:MAG TPA: hypothetical protein DEO57_08380, partial [Phycisphaerales bacterium]|nr:hypothetical protein [Phycisphaerales bacterium]